MADTNITLKNSICDEILTKLLLGTSKKQLIVEYCTVKTAKIFSDKEIMNTAMCFFDSDLNICKTAQRLFMHRNTLNYRLEKIRKNTGFDLRQFDSACAFKILYTIFLGVNI